MEEKTTQIHPGAVIHKDACLGSGVKIGPNCVIEKNVSIGDNTELYANVVIVENTVIGKNNSFFPNSVIGAKPQIMGLESDAPTGSLIIGDNNTIREQVTIHSSMKPDGQTKIGNDNLIMIGVHIGHDCIIEEKIVMSNYAQVSGHCKIETGVWLSGMVLMHQFTTLGKWCYAAGIAGINHDVPPFMIVSGHYPPKVRGVNKRGMIRAGLTEAQQENVFNAHKKLYRQGGTLMENAKALAAAGDLDENVQAIIDMITKSSQHRYGRYLETFRH